MGGGGAYADNTNQAYLFDFPYREFLFATRSARLVYITSVR